MKMICCAAQRFLPQQQSLFVLCVLSQRAGPCQSLDRAHCSGLM